MQNNSIRKAIFWSIIVSFLVGGVVGGVMGGVVATYGPTFSWSTGFLPFGQMMLRGKLPVNTNTPIWPALVRVEEDSQTVDVVEKTSPAVVNIIVSKDLSKIYQQRDLFFQFPFEDFFNDFGFPFRFEVPQQPAPKGKQQIGGGSGFVISSDGLILTNKHVVSYTEAEYTVLTNDGKKYDAKVLARDPVLDVAVVKIEAKGLPVAQLGDSDSLAIGQTVIAIGNALGEFRNTVTKGVISGIGRTITAGGAGGEETIERAIQTDAAINPGNSGGPLIDLSGKVVGINTAIAREGQLIGFAIPINEAKRVVESVKKYGKIVRPFLGVRYILLNEEIAKANNFDVTSGALVARGNERTDIAVIPGSPADKAGLVENDIILEVNGTKVDQGNSLASLIAKYSPGEKVKLLVLHKGEKNTVEVKLEEYKE